MAITNWTISLTPQQVEKKTTMKTMARRKVFVGVERGRGWN
jgi:hypothetical protein